MLAVSTSPWSYPLNLTGSLAHISPRALAISAIALAILGAGIALFYTCLYRPFQQQRNKSEWIDALGGQEKFKNLPRKSFDDPYRKALSITAETITDPITVLEDTCNNNTVWIVLRVQKKDPADNDPFMLILRLASGKCEMFNSKYHKDVNQINYWSRSFWRNARPDLLRGIIENKHAVYRLTYPL